MAGAGAHGPRAVSKHLAGVVFGFPRVLVNSVQERTSRTLLGDNTMGVWCVREGCCPTMCWGDPDASFKD